MSCSYRWVRAAGTCVHCARERGSGSTRGGYWVLVLVQHSNTQRKFGPKHQHRALCAVPKRHELFTHQRSSCTPCSRTRFRPRRCP